MDKITLDIKEAAALIGVSHTTMYTAVREGQIPHKKVRGRILFHRDTIEAWLRGEPSGQKAQ
ncbi:helix-turn-helix domain-containing protein [Cohnella yongneupensis]|uniref:Helix-turn-helix domain-containing protein n=1 Tax=Cohnella yongneupensis TaxID=425006 RepID=A0ABW0RA52_9BACL